MDTHIPDLNSGAEHYFFPSCAHVDATLAEKNGLLQQSKVASYLRDLEKNEPEASIYRHPLVQHLYMFLGRGDADIALEHIRRDRMPPRNELIQKISKLPRLEMPGEEILTPLETLYLEVTAHLDGTFNRLTTRQKQDEMQASQHLMHQSVYALYEALESPDYGSNVVALRPETSAKEKNKTLFQNISDIKNMARKSAISR
jgi:hypothetical protein